MTSKTRDWLLPVLMVLLACAVTSATAGYIGYSEGKKDGDFIGTCGYNQLYLAEVRGCIPLCGYFLFAQQPGFDDRLCYSATVMTEGDWKAQQQASTFQSGGDAE